MLCMYKYCLALQLTCTHIIIINCQDCAPLLLLYIKVCDMVTTSVVPEADLSNIPVQWGLHFIGSIKDWFWKGMHILVVSCWNGCTGTSCMPYDRLCVQCKRQHASASTYVRTVLCSEPITMVVSVWTVLMPCLISALEWGKTFRHA